MQDHDEELIARLREIQGQAGLFASAAADRIEALVKDKRYIIDERDRTFALMLARAETSEARAERLEAALRFYADEDNYTSQYRRLSCECCSDDFIPVEEDRGETARAALTQTEQTDG